MKISTKGTSATSILEELLTQHFKKNKDSEDTDTESLQLAILPVLAQKTDYKIARAFMDDPILFKIVAQRAVINAALQQSQTPGFGDL